MSESISRAKNDGRAKHPLSPTYFSMKSRCYRKADIAYKHYGGRGIKMCDRWLGDDGIWNFIEDMGDRPEGYTLDRKDNEGDYTLDNCEWVDVTQQVIKQRLRKDNTSGHKGVGRTGKKWQAYIKFQKRHIYLGVFEDKQDAIEARKQAEIKYFERNGYVVR